MGAPHFVEVIVRLKKLVPPALATFAARALSKSATSGESFVVTVFEELSIFFTAALPSTYQ